MRYCVRRGNAEMTGMLKTGSSGVEEGMHELHQDGHPYLTARSDVCIIQYRYVVPIMS